jgi:hypothetical protein
VIDALVAVGALAVVVGALLPPRRGQPRPAAAMLLILGGMLLALTIALRRILGAP